MAKAISKGYERAIYGLHAGDGIIRYIGQSPYVPERLALHRYRAKKGEHNHIPVYKWINEIGPDKVQAVIIEKYKVCTIKHIHRREKYNIKVYRANQLEGTPLLNVTDGGWTVANIKKGPEHPRYGAVLTEEHLEAIHTGRKLWWEGMTKEDRSAHAEKGRRKAIENYKKRTPEQKAEDAIKCIEGQRLWKDAHTDEEIHYSKSRGPHVRYHINDGHPNPKCIHCQEEGVA